MDHVMIDIETMSTKPKATILSIGAVLFNPFDAKSEEDVREHPQFHVHISLHDNALHGRDIDPSTIMWWIAQNEEARKRTVGAQTTTLQRGLLLLQKFLTEHHVHFAWANDPDFDITILRSAFDQLNLIWPIKFFNNRSVRTTKYLAYPNNDMPKITAGVAHDALDDCIKQIITVQHCIWRMQNAT